MTNEIQINQDRRKMMRNISMLGMGAAALAATSSIGATTTENNDSSRFAHNKPLKGKVAIVTGARANMGRAFAAALAAMGANVVVHYHRASTKGEAEETARLIREAGQKAVLVQGDLGNLNVVKSMYDTAEKQFGGIDIVVNNAGAIIKKPMAEFTDADFDKLDAVNSRGLFYSLREASRRVREGGRIINNGTSLLAGAAPGYSVYAGTKAPVEEYTRMLAKELGAKRVTVNTVAPGPIDTPFFHSQENERSAAYAANLAAEKRLGAVDDIVPMVEFLASPESQWINGQTLFANGGYLTR